MLESLEFLNFQKHKRRRIDLDPRVTTIIGPTDAGKSAILRALRWVCLNRPQGSSFVRHGRKKTWVKLTVDGRQVVRKRQGTANVYTLDGKTFKAFAGKVPEEVANLLNVSEENFQRQHDSPFWLSDSAGEVSRALNQIVNLGDIDRSLTYLGKELRSAVTLEEVLQKRLQTAQETKKSLAWVSVLSLEVRSLEALQASLDRTHQETSRLGCLIQEVRRHQETLRHLTEQALEGEKVLSLMESWRKVHRDRERLEELIATIRQGQSVLHRPLPDLSDLEDLHERLQAVARDRDRLRALIHQGQMQMDQLTQTWGRLKKAEYTLKKRMKGKCPLCGKKLNSTKTAG